MKMLARYNQVNLGATIIIFLFSGLAFYFLISFVLLEQVDEDLRIERREIVAYIDRYKKLPDSISVTDQQISFSAISKPVKRPSYSTITSPGLLNKEEDVREHTFSVKAVGNWYNVTIKKSLEGTDNMLKSVVGITLATILLVLAVSSLINRIVIKKLWQPFYDALTIIKDFRVGLNQRLSFPATNLDEFEFMNRTLQNTAQKAEQDYILLKEFTENASHEFQTPLAIIRSKMDVLIQDENLTEKQSLVVQSVGEAVQKLSRLNYSLLLLAKIENRQFSEKTLINLKESIENKAVQFKELWEDRSLHVTTQLSDIQLPLNTELADILLNNLFSNATRYNFKNGKINIELTDTSLEISNTGSAQMLEREKMFKRFYNPSKAHSSNGLGLALIKQIAEDSSMIVLYRFENTRHTFTLQFKEKAIPV